MAGDQLDKVFMDVPDVMVKQIKDDVAKAKVNKSLGGDSEGVTLNFAKLSPEVTYVGKVLARTDTPLGEILKETMSHSWAHDPATGKQLGLINSEVARGHITKYDLTIVGLWPITSNMKKGEASAIIAYLKKKGY